MNKIKVNGLSIGFEQKGNGEPLLLLHGGISDSRYWDRELDTFSNDYRVIAWDAPGCGVSDDTPENFSMVDYANTLAGFLDKIKVTKPHVLGISYGGGLALELFNHYADVPKTLILVSAYAGWGGSLPPDEVERRVIMARKYSTKDPEILADEVIPTLFSSSPTSEMIDKVKKIIVDFHPFGMKVMLEGFAKADLRGVLPNIDVPTLLLYGDQDVRSPLEIAQAFHEKITTSRLEILPGVGHVINIEAPEAFDTRVREFLSVYSH